MMKIPGIDGLEGWLKSVVKDFVIGFLTRLVSGGISNNQLIEMGEAHGRWLTDNCKRGIGGNWEGLESVLQDKAGIYFVGLMTGMDYDDKAA